MREWWNPKTAAGAVLILAVLILGADPGTWVHISPYAQDVWHPATATSTASMPPFPPSRQHWLGTDQDGHDLFARILYGALPTLWDATWLVLAVWGVSVAIALLRVVWRIPFPLVDLATGLTTLVPPMLVALLLLEAPAFYFSPRLNLWYYAVITCLESARFIPTLEGDLRLILARPFIEAAHTTGCSPWRILTRHVWPWFRPYLAEYVPLSYARVLAVMGELAYFGIFSHLRLIRSDSAVVIDSRQLDWPALIGMGSQHWFSDPAPVLFPTLALCVLILGLRLLAAGVSPALEGNPSGWGPSSLQSGGRRVRRRAGWRRRARYATLFADNRGSGGTDV
ncbi:hypothetical protein [Alicyclobacillus sp.]|uniref:hypothetical protein n=1 Tax=Alicyclobacillus sp. TaxID=61169 RepID=UPI0025C6F0AE|nr:hypothetical protein [Alicyclobacillus sp.]MCL6516333.1 hypothetical protein [Alicyclobacillus sp.]